MMEKKQNILSGQQGIALVTALIVTLVVFLLIVSTLYVITSSTTVSGAGERYASASEAADGAVEVMQESINLVMYGEPSSSLPVQEQHAGDLISAMTTTNNPKTVTLNLAGTGLATSYTAEITVERLYSKALPGGRLEFARSAGGSGGTAVYFRISTVVTGPNNTKAETTALYRFVG